MTTRQLTAHYHRSQQQELAPVLVLVGGDGQDARAIHGSSRSVTVHPSAFVLNGPRLVVATLGWRNGPLLSARSDDDDEVAYTEDGKFCDLPLKSPFISETVKWIITGSRPIRVGSNDTWWLGGASVYGQSSPFNGAEPRCPPLGRLYQSSYDLRTLQSNQIMHRWTLTCSVFAVDNFLVYLFILFIEFNSGTIQIK